MTQRARLITPQGKRIELTTAKYRQIRRLLTSRSRKSSRAKITRVIASTYGKYAGGASLTQALLEERTTERAREDNKLRRLNG